MRRLRYLSLAMAVCLAAAPASTSAAAATSDSAPSVVSVRAQVSATQVIIRPRSSAGMASLETRLKRDGATVLERSRDGESLLVEVPEGHGSARYARDIAAAVPTDVAEPLGYVYASAVPSDPDYPLQWGLPAIGAPAAWDRSWGDADVVVAVIDSGVDLDHPDLAAQIVPGGLDFVDDDAVPDDEYGHGTHVAGIVAATADNGVLGSGTAPGCGILPMRVLDASGEGTTLDLGDAIYNATDQGVDVINLSLGRSAPNEYLSLAVEYAIAHDVVIVAAAGNCSPIRLSDVEYPAREPGVIAVGAVQLSGPYTIASFSQDGAALDIVAPGTGIYSTTRDAAGGYMTGTSMATPFVAGTAALMRTIEPAATYAEITTALTATAIDLGALGRDDTYGYGLVQADAALDSVGRAPSTTLSTDVSPASSGWYLTAPQITLTPDEPATTYYAWDGGGESVYGAPLTAAEGQHTLGYRSVDGESNAEIAKTQLFKVDTIAPTVPADLTATATSSSAVSLSWSAATDATSGVAQYQVYSNGTSIGLTTALTYPVSGLAPGTTYDFTVSAVDVASNESAASAPESATTFQVVPAITTTSLAAGLKGRPYAATLAATGGTPITWSVSAGTLPAGLALSSVGVISGTPSESGTFTFTARAENTGGSDTQALALVVSRVAAPVYRFYNITNGTHFYTDSKSERDHVIATWPNVFSYEGVAYTTDPANNTQPLYRFYNHVSGSHFYTASLDEASTILARWSDVYSLDGQTYAVNPVPVTDGVPVYRFYNLRNGSHFYTASGDERNAVIAQWSATYQYEGTAFWLGQ